MTWINEKTLMRWATRKLGPSKCKKVRYYRSKKQVYGYWDWVGCIHLNKSMIGSTGSLYRTMAHEWTHAQQTWREYKKHIKAAYDDHPLEKAAREAEKSVWGA
jgi:hypothetical protein